MRIPRVYVPWPLGCGEEVPLPESARGHLLRVLRLRVGAPLTLFDGRGGEYRGTLSHCGRRDVRVRIADHLLTERESPLAVTLVQGVCRGDRMDYVIQKATELGVTRIVCVFCDRTVIRLDGRRLEKKRAHWQGILGASCEQSGRNRLPELAIRTSLREALGAEDLPAPRVLLDPGARAGLVTVGDVAARATLLVGPEGGFAAAERAELRAHSFLPIRFGPRILRTETAGVAALTALQVLWGDIT